MEVAVDTRLSLQGGGWAGALWCTLPGGHGHSHGGHTIRHMVQCRRMGTKALLIILSSLNFVGQVQYLVAIGMGRADGFKGTFS